MSRSNEVVPMTYKEYDDLIDERDTLRAELTEARRQLKEASEQEPVAIVESDYGVGDCNTIDTFHPQGTKLYAAPVPQPAVPEAVAKDSDWKHVPVGRVIGDPVWAGQLWSTQIRGTKKLRHGDLVFIHPAAILSATDSEVKNGLR